MEVDKYINLTLKLVYEGYRVLESIEIVKGWIVEDERLYKFWNNR